MRASNGDLRVSSRGQMSLPAAARHRWGLDDGGDVAFLDLGIAVVIVPGRTESLRRSFVDAVTDEGWELARLGFGDDDLASE